MWRYVWYFCGVIGRFHLFCLRHEFPFFFVESVPLFLVVDFGQLQFYDIFLFLGYVFLKFVDLVDYLIELLLGLE